jgi:hypothetical protein
MNVLILTPDRVGSTLLQRLVTIYMLRRGFDKPVINLHELTNGLIKYYNELLNQEVLGKPQNLGNWGYHQSLREVVELLASTDHYKTCRLAHYHLLRREDSIEDRLAFYKYINENFYIISARRENLFEHGLSWVIVDHSKKLNTYSALDKVDTFTELYKQGITATRQGLHTHLTRYHKYTEWCDTHFNVQSYFNYDTDIKNIEEYILGLDFMHGHDKNKWEDMFQQDFKTFNTCHKLIPDLVLKNNSHALGTMQMDLALPRMDCEKYEILAGADWPSYNEYRKGNITDVLRNELAVLGYHDAREVSIQASEEETNFIKDNIVLYKDTLSQITDLVTNGFMVTPVPIKLQSLSEKKDLINNFEQCIDWYNEWVDINGIGEKYSADKLDEIVVSEEEFLKSSITTRLSK